MESLRAVTNVLESMLVHKPGFTNQTRVYLPDDSDSSDAANLKREIIRRSLSVLDAAQARLSGSIISTNAIDGTESDQIEDLLASDADRRDFQELIHHATAAQQFLAETN
jgi:fructose-bisphosphate aldolase class 1